MWRRLYDCTGEIQALNSCHKRFRATLPVFPCLKLLGGGSSSSQRKKSRGLKVRERAALRAHTMFLKHKSARAHLKILYIYIEWNKKLFLPAWDRRPSWLWTLFLNQTLGKGRRVTPKKKQACYVSVSSEKRFIWGTIHSMAGVRMGSHCWAVGLL